MKKISVAGIFVLLLCLFAWGIKPVIAQDFTQIEKPLSVDESDLVNKVPKGSVIYHRADGVTEVRSSNDELVLIANNDEAALVPTPNGLKRATHVVQIPSGSKIIEEGKNITKIYDGDDCILTVVEQGNDGKSGYAIPDWDEWIEWSHDWSVDNIDWFRAYWEVPFDPPLPDNDAVDFLLNAITNQQGNKIIQPVLEWNQLGSNRWTGAAWYAGVTTYRATPVNASEGNLIRGTMSYIGSSVWYIEFYNSSTSSSSSFYSGYSGFNEQDDNLAIFCALEGENIDDNNDVPGDTGFYNMEFEYNNSTVDIQWQATVESVPGLSGLSVGRDTSAPIDDTWITLYTAN